jgi:hypothetical protein
MVRHLTLNQACQAKKFYGTQWHRDYMAAATIVCHTGDGFPLFQMTHGDFPLFQTKIFSPK